MTIGLLSVSGNEAKLAPVRVSEEMDLSRLTPRERSVVTLLDRGYPDWMVAKKLAIRPDTVRKYVAHAVEKLGSEYQAFRALGSFHRKL